MINKNLIFKLSLFGLFMAVGTVYFISSRMEPILWLLIFIICAFIIARQAPAKYFMHGFLLGLANCVWVVAAHVLLFNSYIATHAEEAAMMGRMAMATHPRVMMILTGPVIGVISGLIIGLFAFIASRLVKKTSAVQ